MHKKAFHKHVFVVFNNKKGRNVKLLNSCIKTNTSFLLLLENTSFKMFSLKNISNLHNCLSSLRFQALKLLIAPNRYHAATQPSEIRLFFAKEKNPRLLCMN